MVLRVSKRAYLYVKVEWGGWVQSFVFQVVHSARMVPHFFDLYQFLGLGPGHQLMHACNVFMTYGVMDMLVGYTNSKCMDGKTFIRVFHIHVSHGEPLDVAPEWLSFALHHQPQTS